MLRRTAAYSCPMDDRAVTGDDGELAFAERVPIYAKLFGIGLLATAGLGLAIGLLTSVDVMAAFAYSLVALAVILMMSGGTTGGGYTNLGVGAFTNMFGGRREIEGVDDMELVRNPRRSMDLEDRLRRGLRPGPNPQAFWQVVAGLSYLAIGVAILMAIG